jgi:hypothetical protein
VAGFRYTSVTGSRAANADGYSTGPTSPFGAFSTDSEQRSLYATYTAGAPPAAPVNTAPPAISGAARVGQTLTASTGTWSNTPTAYTYQWSRCSSSGTGCTAIAGAPSYTVQSADVSHTLRVAVTASNGGGSSAPATSAATGIVTAGPATFGYSAVGGSADSFSANRKRVNAYSLPQSGSVSKLSMYLSSASSSGQADIKGVVYADSGGAPGALLGTTSQLVFSGGEATGWYDLTFPTALNLAAGKYWIGVITGGGSGVAGFRYTSVTGSRDYNSDTYTTGPTSSFGAFSTDSEQMSLYATFTAG